MITCMLLQPCGTASRHSLQAHTIITEAQKLIGGYIEPLVIKRDGKLYTLLLDEDGRSRMLPRNPSASVLAGQTIVGPALLFMGSLEEMETEK